jgi:hypothetical protein
MESLKGRAARATAQYIMHVENQLRNDYSRTQKRSNSAGKYLNYDKLPDQILSRVMVHFNEQDQKYHFGDVIKSPHEHKITLTTRKTIKLMTTDHIDYAELYTDWGGLIDRCVPEFHAGVYRLNFLRGSPIHNGITLSLFYIIVGTADQEPPTINMIETEKNITYEEALLNNPNYIQDVERTMCIERVKNFLIYGPWSVTVRRHYT